VARPVDVVNGTKTRVALVDEFLAPSDVISLHNSDPEEK
jgi:hypothetical protein